MSKPILNYDRENDILYIVIREGNEHHFVEAADGIIVEFNVRNQPIGIEIMDASRVITSVMGHERLAVTR